MIEMPRHSRVRPVPQIRYPDQPCEAVPLVHQGYKYDNSKAVTCESHRGVQYNCTCKTRTLPQSCND